MAREVKVKKQRTDLSADDLPNDNSTTQQDHNVTARSVRLFPFIIGAIAFLVYLRTMSPAMQMGDGTELATAAQVLGVPHPTGYPFYMLISKLWLLITMAGDVIVRTTLLNAIFMSVAVGLTAKIFYDILGAIWKTRFSKAQLILAGSGALTVAFLRFHWANAVVTEVYALEFLLMALFVRTAQKMDMARKLSPRSLIALTVFLAIGLAHHRLSVTMILPWIAVCFLAFRNRHTSGFKMPWIPIAAILIAGASLYAYLPIRAAAHPPVNWGNTINVPNFYNHVRGTEYLDRGLLKPALGQSFSADTLAMFTRLQTNSLLSDLAGQFVPFTETVNVVPGTQKIFIHAGGLVTMLGLLIVAASAWGIYCLWRNRMKWFAAILTAVALQNILILYIYNIADIRDYFLFPFWAATVALFAATAFLLKSAHNNKQLYAAYLSLLLPLIVLTGNWHRTDRSQDLNAELLSATILPDKTDIVPLNSILITDDDSETFTTWYRQIVRGDRPDVLNFAGNFVYMPWYKTFFTPQQLSDYKIKLADNVALSADQYAGQLRQGIIDANVATHPVFTSINDPAVLSSLAQTYDVSPVDAVETVNMGLFDEMTTTVLYRIQVKDKTQ